MYQLFINEYVSYELQILHLGNHNRIQYSPIHCLRQFLVRNLGRNTGVSPNSDKPEITERISAPSHDVMPQIIQSYTATTSSRSAVPSLEFAPTSVTHFCGGTNAPKSQHIVSTPTFIGRIILKWVLTANGWAFGSPVCAAMNIQIPKNAAGNCLTIWSSTAFSKWHEKKERDYLSVGFENIKVNYERS
jgi:hypothetical protein